MPAWLRRFFMLAVVAVSTVSAGSSPVATAATPAASPNFAMTTPTASEPLQSALFQITLTTSGPVARVTVALPTSMTAGAVTRTVTTLPLGRTTISGSTLTYTVTKPSTLLSGTRIWLTVSGIATPPPGSVAPLIQVWSPTGARLTAGTAPARTFSAKPPCPAAGWPSDYIKTENARPGTTAWKIANPGIIQAYAEAASGVCGSNVYIRSDGPLGGAVRLSAYRMGYYGGLGARLVFTTTTGPWLLGDDQPAPMRIATNSAGQTVNEVKATNWRRTFGFAIDGRFVPGTYLITLTDSSGRGSYVPLTVRDDVGTHDYSMLSSTNTWQSYNDFGGWSAYTSPRSQTLSYDRPYAQNAGSGDYLGFEYGYVFWAEKQGLDTAYVTDMDLHYTPGASLRGTFVMPGHAEYWSPQMRAAMVDRVAAGTNVMSLGSNMIYWQVRPLSWREFTAFKGSYGLDPRFRDVGLAEQSILGGMYSSCHHVDGTVVTDKESWLWAGVAEGTQIPHLPAAEVDRQVPAYPVPQGSMVLSTTPLSACDGSSDPQDHFMQVTTVEPGAGAGRVFNAGSIGWGCALSDQCIAYGTPYSVTTSGAAAVGQATVNALSWLTTGVSPVIDPPPPPQPGALRVQGGLPDWVERSNEAVGSQP